MASLRVSEDIRSLSEFRANVAAFVEQVRRTHRPLVLTQHGRSRAVLLDVAEYERLVERAELLEDVERRAITEALTQSDGDRAAAATLLGIELDDLRERLNGLEIA